MNADQMNAEHMTAIARQAAWDLRKFVTERTTFAMARNAQAVEHAKRAMLIAEAVTFGLAPSRLATVALLAFCTSPALIEPMRNHQYFMACRMVLNGSASDDEHATVHAFLAMLEKAQIERVQSISHLMEH